MDRNAAFIAFYESHHMADGRGFPASVRADKPEYAALLNNIEELDLLLKAEYKVHRKFTTFIH